MYFASVSNVRSYSADTVKKSQMQRSEQVAATEKAPSRLRGVLTEWNDERGCGFITPDNGGQRVFLHVKSLLPKARRPVAGEVFFYKLTTDIQGRPRAAEAFQTTCDEQRDLPLHHSIIKGLARFWPLAPVLPLILTIRTDSLATGLTAAFIVNSLLTILLYWEDKYLARYKYWRIPEKHLHIWEFLCGWPGALYAQHAFRHKRSKTSYMIVFWLCVIANVAILFLLFFQEDALNMEKTLEGWWHNISSR